MNTRNRYFKIYKKIRLVNLQPTIGWDNILLEPASTGWHLKHFVFPIMIAISIATFLGYLLFALNLHHFSFLYSVIKTLAVFCESFFTFYISTLIIYELALKLKIIATYDSLFRLLCYSFSLFWVASFFAGILANYPTLGSFLRFLGLFGIFTFSVGTDKLKIVENQNKQRFLIVSILIIILIYLIIGWSFDFVLRSIHNSSLGIEN